MTDNQRFEELKEILGEENAQELVRLIKNYDKYLAKFKKGTNNILNSFGYEVKTGFVVQPISDREE